MSHNYIMFCCPTNSKDIADSWNLSKLISFGVFTDRDRPSVLNKWRMAYLTNIQDDTQNAA